MKVSAALCGVIALSFGTMTSKASRTSLVYSYLAKKSAESYFLLALAAASSSSSMTSYLSPVAMSFSKVLFLYLKVLRAAVASEISLVA